VDKNSDNLKREIGSRVKILERDMGKRIEEAGTFQESINKKVAAADDAHTA
jgi:hypothetical protein